MQAERVDRVIVATDDSRIASAVVSFGGEVRMTRVDHPSGTDRVAEVVETMALSAGDIVLNVQGDEPELEAGALDELVAALTQREYAERSADGVRGGGIATLAAPFADDGPAGGAGSPADPNCVKVVVGVDGCALYFSRSLVPYPRDTQGRVDKPSRWLVHLGVYAFRVAALRQVAALGGTIAGGSEAAESLEQLRWLENGLSVRVVWVARSHAGIDTP